MTDPFDVFAAAREAPERLALVEPERAWSYADLAVLCRRALGWLRAKGLAPSDSVTDVVAVLAEPTPHQIAMTFALMAAGVPCLPLHPRLTEPERAALLDHAGATLLVDAAWQHEPAFPIAPEPSELLRGRAHEALLALVQTSGTTAGPRLAKLSRRAFQASAVANAAHLGWTDDDRWLLALPFAHIGGLSILTRCLAARSTVALAGLPPAAVSGQSAALVADRMNGLGASLLSLVPTQLEQLLELCTWRAPSSLRAVLVGGAAVSEATLERARARGLPVLPTYGMTETCSQICTRAVGAGPEHAGVGAPLAGVDLTLVDGEIHVRGPVLFSGYWGEPEAYDPSTWFATGDLGRMDAAGRLHVLGRLADRIISGGENVNPLEVEQVLAPCVAPRRLCVFGHDDPLWGEQVAVAIEGSTDQVLVERIRQAALAALASFKRPRLVTFVERLPERASGKVLRRALKESRSVTMIPVAYTRG